MRISAPKPAHQRTRMDRLTRRNLEITAVLAAAILEIAVVGNRAAALWMTAFLIAAIGITSLLERREDTKAAAGSLEISGLATFVDDRRRDGLMIEPLAAVVIELRGIAADTVVDGAAAWSEPLRLVTQRLANADIEGLHISRIGPHSFGAVAPAVHGDEATAMAETLVSLCRIPIPTPVREIRIDAVAGTAFARVGERISGEELLRAADASLRVDSKAAAPVAAHDSRLRSHARRVIEVETEIRYSLDVDLLTARLSPVVNVHNDRVIGLRSAYDWTAVSSAEPEILRSIADSLGLRRSIETQYLMRSIAAAESLPQGAQRPVVARIDAARLTDRRAASQLALLIRASGIDPSSLIFEFDCWGASVLGTDGPDALAELGVGIGIAVHYRDHWDKIPVSLIDDLDAVSVTASDVMEPDGSGPSAMRISRLTRLLDGNLAAVAVTDVDSVAVALELSAAGLSIQSGSVHGRPMAASDLRGWIAERSPQ